MEVKSNLRQAIRTYQKIPISGDSAAPYYKPISAKLINFEVNRSISGLKEVITQAEPLFSRDKIVAAITEDILLREIAYCLNFEGHPHQLQANGTRTIQPDSHFSYLRHYAVEQHSTGLTVFDRLYEDVRGYIEHSRQTINVPAHLRDPWLCGREMLEWFDTIVSHGKSDGAHARLA